LRSKAGEISRYSSGTYVDAKGTGHHLTSDQVKLTPRRTWHKYPVDWQIAIPSLDLELDERATLDNQEWATSSGPTASYWEGAVTYDGTAHQRQIRGAGYLELTGYAQPVRLGH
jgi:predicted secreted hydrolase